MQRKTNLFYTEGQDSNFLTFSNFTEALTGNFLSVDCKLYPSRFLCINMPILIEGSEEDMSFRNAKDINISAKKYFIKNYLAGYYENKLAFLRDYYTKENSNNNNIVTYDIEADINSLGWLIMSFKKFIEEVKSVGINDVTFKVTFIGDVTEFDYKGTYTDIICIIDSSDGYVDSNLVKYDIEDVEADEENLIPCDVTDKLYGWSTDELAGSEYQGLSPLFDEDNKYNISNTYKFEKSTEDTEVNSLDFNLIIPVFDVIWTDPNENFTQLEEDTDLYELLNTSLKSRTGKESKNANSPLGIWFSDKFISLEKDQSANYAPSWSIIISTQFKPFPYSSNYDNNDITSKDNQQAFATYAQILSKQKMISSKIDEFNIKLLEIENSLNTPIEDLLNNEYVKQIIDDKVNSRVNEILNNLDIDTMIQSKLDDHINEYHTWKN